MSALATATVTGVSRSTIRRDARMKQEQLAGLPAPETQSSTAVVLRERGRQRYLNLPQQLRPTNGESCWWKVVAGCSRRTS